MTIKEDIMSIEKPKGFEDLKPAELYRSALEDFALPVEVEDKTKKKVLLAAFLEGGVTWDDYVAQHPEVAPTAEEVQAEVTEASLRTRLREGTVITSDAPKHNTVGTPEEAVVDQPRVVVKEEIPVNAPHQYLIKMVRDNPLFEIRGHKFTQAHPYAIVSAKDADYILREDGFRQALPSELAEFYG